MLSNEQKNKRGQFNSWHLEKTMEGLSLHEAFTLRELRPKYGYDYSRCPDCKVKARPDSGDTTDANGRTLPCSVKRKMKILVLRGNEHIIDEHIIYDPICPKCRKRIPAVIRGGKAR